MTSLLLYWWPIACLVISNIFYHITAKEVPDISPFATMTVTYLVASAISATAFFITGGKDANLLHEMQGVNWAVFVLGIAIVGLEVGAIYMYRVGWEVSVGNMIASTILSIALVVVGYLLYSEAISMTKVIGILVCLAGLYLINK